MRRRALLRVGAAGASLGLAGCISFGGGGNGSNGSSLPPPRKSEVFGNIMATDESLVVNLAADPWVNSRADVNANAGLAAILPVGRAAAKGRGRGSGATGRGRGGWASAPRRGGRAIHHGHEEDDEWRDDHDDEITQYDAVPMVTAVGYMGTEEEFADDPPPAGPLSEWDQRWTDVEPDEQLTMPVEQTGWYRVGTQLQSEGGSHDFGWESVDFKLEGTGDGYEVENPWKVSPRV